MNAMHELAYQTHHVQTNIKRDGDASFLAAVQCYNGLTTAAAGAAGVHASLMLRTPLCCTVTVTDPGRGLSSAQLILSTIKLYVLLVQQRVWSVTDMR